MNKDYQFLELMNDINDEYIKTAALPWTSIKKQMKNRMLKAVAGISIVFLLTGALAFREQVEAGIKMFTTKIAKILGIELNLEDYTETFHISQTKEGITLTLEEVLVAEDRIYLVIHKAWDANVNLKDGLQEPLVGCEIEKINNESFMCISSRGAYGKEHDEAYMMIYETNTLPEKIDSIDIRFLVNLSLDREEEMIFLFKVKVDDSEIRIENKNIPLDIMIYGENGEELKLKNLSFNSLYSQILTESYEMLSTHMMKRQYKLMGQDSLGNIIDYRISGGIDGDITFESSQMVPDIKCEWIELQLYAVETELSFIRKNEIEDSEYITEEYTSEEYAEEEYIEEEYGQEWSEEDYKPIGEKVKIFINNW